MSTTSILQRFEKVASFDPLHGDPRFAAVKDARTRLAIAAQQALHGGGSLPRWLLPAVFGTAAGAGTGLGLYLGLKKHQSKAKTAAMISNAGEEKAAAFSAALDLLWTIDPPPMPGEKTASAYFDGLRRESVDRDLFGSQFCKLASAIDEDTWCLAQDVEENLPAFMYLAKHGSGQNQELAQFYVNWADSMILKTSAIPGLGKMVGGLAKGIGGLVRGGRAAAEGGAIAAKAGKMGLKRAVKGAVSAPGRAVGAVRQQGQQLAARARGQYAQALRGPSRRQMAQKAMAARPAPTHVPGTARNLPGGPAVRPTGPVATAANPQAQSALKQRITQARQARGAQMPTPAARPAGPAQKRYGMGTLALGGLAVGAPLAVGASMLGGGGNQQQQYQGAY